MKRHETTSIARYSAITTALVLTLYYMFSIGHADINKKLKPSIKHLMEAKFENLTFKMQFKKAEVATGDSPEIVVAITNNSDKPEKCSVGIGINSTKEASKMMRMIPFPRAVWFKKLDLSLAANETKELTLKTNYVKKDKETLSISLIPEGTKLTPELSLMKQQPPLVNIDNIKQASK